MNFKSRMIRTSCQAALALALSLLAAVLFVLSQQVGFSFYIASYLSVMLAFSMIGAPAATLLNEESTDEIRSTMQSLESFMMMAGGAVASFGFAVIVNRFGIAQTWAVVAAVLFAGSVLLVVMSRGDRNT